MVPSRRGSLENVSKTQIKKYFTHTQTSTNSRTELKGNSNIHQLSHNGTAKNRA